MVIVEMTIGSSTMDLVYIAVILLFFALLIGLAVGCARLGGVK